MLLAEHRCGEIKFEPEPVRSESESFFCQVKYVFERSD